jgi:Helicase HerA, central domain
MNPVREDEKMEDFEKLGVFYLGRQYDLKEQKMRDGLLLYDSKDLVTHAVIVGMTGSGKTGLGIGLIEEAVLDNIPVIAIDPKGDLGDLLLTFPQLRGEDFLPWINVDDARQSGVSPQEYANQQAALWTKGLGDWGQSGERIQRLRDAADWAIYTPGSNAGLPVSILKSFAAPGQAVLDDSDLLRERITTTATSLLTLVGIEADPVQSREHILLSTILDQAWRQGQDLDLPTMIRQVESPPVTKVGVLDIESFYPAKERFGLVMALNSLLASPGFNAWLEGEPLDIGQILYTSTGKPRVAIFSVAHLSDAERMFFVSLLLNQVLGWMRTQAGTTSLRALLYMDEVFGYFPPLANPPSKLPMLTLLKQARAFGLGVVLSTQNPVDLDYKGLSNAGTWFIGRLQTERDKGRLLDGLEGAAVSASATFSRQEVEQTIAGLGKRVFLMNNVHESAPEVFQTRWAMSYLSGPLTRDQIKQLMDPRKATAGIGATPIQGESAAVTPAPTAVATAPTGVPPALPPDVPRFFIPARGQAPSGSSLTYVPKIVGAAQVRFADPKTRVQVAQAGTWLTPITDEAIPVNWNRAEAVKVAVSDLEKNPPSGARYSDLPPVASQARSYATWTRDLSGWLYGNQALELLRSPSLGDVSNPDEAERDFRIRLGQRARELRDKEVDNLRAKYSTRLATLQERIRRAEQAVEREKAQATQTHISTALSVGATVLGGLLGRKRVSTSVLTRATSAARGAGRSLQQQGDVGRAQETVEALEQQLKDLEAEFEAEKTALVARIDPLTETLETVAIKPKKADITVELVALAWAPYWQDAQGMATPAW